VVRKNGLASLHERQATYVAIDKRIARLLIYGGPAKRYWWESSEVTKDCQIEYRGTLKDPRGYGKHDMMPVRDREAPSSDPRRVQRQPQPAARLSQLLVTARAAKAQTQVARRGLGGEERPARAHHHAVVA